MTIEARHFKDLVDHLFDGVYILDRQRRILYWNQAAERITGFAAQDVLGTSCSDNVLIHVDRDGRSLCGSEHCPALQVMRKAEALEAEVFDHHKDGHRLPVLTRILPMRDGTGQVVGAMELFRDNSSVAAMRAEFEDLRRLSLLDPLTEVGNRRYLEIHLRARLDEFERYGWRFGLLFCDIDRFKPVNDEFGHATGDEAIKMVAATLANCVRPFDLVGRWGGDEFVAIIARVELWQLYAIAERLRLLVQQSPIRTGARTLGVTISIGATLVRPGDTADTVLARADELLYRSKTSGADRVTTDEHVSLEAGK